MTARRRNEQFAPTVRSEGPPGIDWTQVQPDCPACWRAWLEGDLPGGPLLSRRAHAAVVAAALALSSTAPTVVLAAGHPAHRGHAGLHDSDPGDAGVGLPVADSPSAPATPEPDPPDADPEGPDPGTAETPPPPVTDESGPDAPGDSGPAPESPAPGDENPVPQAPADPPAAQTPPAPPASPPSATTAGPTTPIAPQSMRSERHTVIKGERARVHRSSRLTTGKATASSSRPVSTRTVVLGTANTVSGAGRAQPGDRTHVVRAGESLWSIASDLVGSRASSSRIAAEVARLWALNRGRIGTGDPNLLRTGTLLRLR